MGKVKNRRLPVRKRTILSGDGETSTARTVFCPKHGEAVALPVCGECAECNRIDLGTVECHPEMAQPTMRWSPMLRRMLPSTADRVAIADVMTRDVLCVRVEVAVEQLRALFRDRNISAAPVVDAEGLPIGFVSKSDLVTLEPNGADTVGDIMMPLAFTLREDDPLSRAAAVMAVEGVHHLPVVSADGRVVGILSSLDFVRWVAAQSGFVDQA